jgi:autotransporter family porin
MPDECTMRYLGNVATDHVFDGRVLDIEVAMFRLRSGRLLFVPTLALLGCLSASVATTWFDGAGPDDTATWPSSRFRTIPPGAPLPDDGTCARLVQPTPETVPDNAPFNATPGRRRLPGDFFDPDSHDPRANADVASRVSGAYTGTTGEILQWLACKWGIDEQIVRAQAVMESSWRQTMKGDWSTNAADCAPAHGPGVDGRPGQCPESWGILQVRYQFFSGAFPDAVASTPFNGDTAYAVWRACFEGYETWLRDTAPRGRPYRPGDAWGCVGRWYSGEWHTAPASRYISCVRGIVAGREPCP